MSEMRPVENLQSSNVTNARLYLDVSSTAVSPLITGIPRVVRALADFRDKNEVHLLEFDGLANSYKRIQDLRPPDLSTDTVPKSKRAIVATKLYKILTENKITGAVSTTLLRNRFVFYVARRILGAPSSNGELLKNPQGILFLPEVPLHNAHVKKILELKNSGSLKLVLFLHDLLPIQHPEYFSHDLIWKFSNYTQLIEIADLILVSNEDVKSEVEGHFSTKSVHVVALPSTYACNVGKSEPNLRFLVVGTIEPRKNFMAILDAFEKLHTVEPTTELRIVGNLGWKYTNIVDRIRALQKHGVGIHWTQNLSDNDLRVEYQHALALVYPSHFEGYGLPVIEALSQATPVITSNRPSMRLFERFGGVTLIDPDSVDELFRAMQRMLNLEYRNNQSQEIKISELPTSWSEFASECFRLIKEV